MIINSDKFKNNLLFLKSSQTLSNPFITTKEIEEWVKLKNKKVEVNIERVPFEKLSDWTIEGKVTLKHKTGRFFSIDGISVETNWGNISQWDQPIINQPEIGFLGILTKEFNGILYFLMQAKIEPGNINYVQISPTLQATKSNYTTVHKGKVPKYLDYFLDRLNNEILLDQLQSEQGARFLKKRNRNIIIKVNCDVEVHEDFCWMTLGQIKELCRLNNVVNMDTRTVISGIQFGSYSSNTLGLYTLMRQIERERSTQFLISALNNESSLYTFDEIIHWFTNLKTQYDLIIKKIPLHKVSNWLIEDYKIRHVDNKFFEVVGVNVTISNREVSTWNQPLIKPLQEGICAFIIKKMDSVLHFLVQAKLEAGNFDILEMAPTVQCITGSYDNKESYDQLPFLEYVLTADRGEIVLDTLQSEEGGRFYQEQNRNMLLLVKDDFPNEVPDNYIWMTLNQINTFIKFNNYLNIQARSLISAISFTETFEI